MNRLKVISLAVSSLFSSSAVQVDSNPFVYDVLINSMADSKQIFSSIGNGTIDYINASTPLYWDRQQTTGLRITANEDGTFVVPEPINYLPYHFITSYPSDYTDSVNYIDLPINYGSGSVANDRLYYLRDTSEIVGNVIKGKIVKDYYGAFVNINTLTTGGIPSIEHLELDSNYSLSNGLPIEKTNYFLYAIYHYSIGFDYKQSENAINITFDLSMKNFSKRNASGSYSKVNSPLLPVSIGFLNQNISDGVTSYDWFTPFGLVFNGKRAYLGNGTMVFPQTNNPADLFTKSFHTAPDLAYNVPLSNGMINYSTTGVSFALNGDYIGDSTKIFLGVFPFANIRHGFNNVIYQPFGGSGSFFNFSYELTANNSFPSEYIKLAYRGGQDNNLNYKNGYQDGYNYALSLNERTDYNNAFGFINSGIQSIASLLDTEVFPGIKISLFVFLPLMLGVICVILKFLH